MANDQDDVETLAGFLGDEDPPVGRILAAISAACVDNARLVRNRAGICGAVGSRNDFGDAQLEVDVLCDANTVRHLGDVSDVSSVASEEKPCHTPLHPETGDYSVAYDPLDGSSIVGCNWSVGSIFGIWKSKRLDDTDGKSLVSCAVCVFGPRCTLWIPSATASGGVVEFTYDEDSSAWVKSTTVTDLSGAKRVFSPANLRCTSDNVGYAQLIAYYMAERYTLRYTGGLVPDVCGILSRRCGIFTSPTSSTAAAKLRVLYEVMPMALLVENAGGSACDEHGTRILDMKVTGFDQRSGLVCGEKNEVDRYIELVCSSTTNKK